MRELLKRITTYRNISWLLYIIFYLIYLTINIFINKGNYYINMILLILTGVYLLMYIYSAFIAMNKRLRKQSKKIFIKSKKFIAFANASLVLTSVISNDSNSFFTVFFAVITIITYLLYLTIDIAASIAFKEIKRYTKNLGWKYDSRS